MLIQSGMLRPPAVTSTRNRTRANCAKAISQRRIAATSDAGFFISTLMGAASEPATTALAFNLERAGADVNGCVLIVSGAHDLTAPESDVK